MIIISNVLLSGYKRFIKFTWRYLFWWTLLGLIPVTKINYLFLAVYSNQSRSSLSGVTDLKKAFSSGFRYPPSGVVRNGVTAQGVTTSLITKLCTAFGTVDIEKKFVKELCKANLLYAVTGNCNCRFDLICARAYACVSIHVHFQLIQYKLFSPSMAVYSGMSDL